MSRRMKIVYLIVAIVVGCCAGFAAAALVDSNAEQVLGAFSTDLAPRSPEQMHNIRLAASKIDGVTLKPGDEFSFNKVVGMCGVTQGYKRAPTIIDRELRPSWGGGVCQVSSTLYNAALLANLDVVERHPHSKRVSSVPPGRDAMTAYGIGDLRFVNSSRQPVRIAAKASEVRLTINILSRAESDISTQIHSTVVGSGRHLPAGDIPHGMLDSSVQGQTVLTYRVVKRNDQEISRELISRDTYAAEALGTPAE